MADTYQPPRDPSISSLVRQWRDAIGRFCAAPRAPVVTVATLPSAADAGRIVYVSDESGGATLAISDGTNWRRQTDLSVVS